MPPRDRPHNQLAPLSRLHPLHCTPLEMRFIESSKQRPSVFFAAASPSASSVAFRFTFTVNFGFAFAAASAACAARSCTAVRMAAPGPPTEESVTVQ